MAQIEKRQRTQELNQETLLRILQDVYTEGEHASSMGAADIVHQLAVHLEPFFGIKQHAASIQQEH